MIAHNKNLYKILMFCCFGLLILKGYHLYSVKKHQVILSKLELKQAMLENFQQEKLKNPRTQDLPNIIFYKTHKTGSSSIQNILYRLSLRENLPILEFPGYVYPEDLDDSIFETRKNCLLGTCNATRMSRPKPRIHLNHIKFDESKILEQMDSQHKLFRFTILREPLSLLKSAFNYYRTATDLRDCFKKLGIYRLVFRANLYLERRLL